MEKAQVRRYRWDPTCPRQMGQCSMRDVHPGNGTDEVLKAQTFGDLALPAKEGVSVPSPVLLLCFNHGQVLCTLPSQPLKQE